MEVENDKLNFLTLWETCRTTVNQKYGVEKSKRQKHMTRQNLLQILFFIFFPLLL